MDANKIAGMVFEALGAAASHFAGRSGPVGKGAHGVARLSGIIGNALGQRGKTVDEIIAGIEAPRDLNLPPELTQPPSAKKRGK